MLQQSKSYDGFRCHLPSGKVLWLCPEHQKMEGVSLLEDVIESTADSSEDSNPDFALLHQLREIADKNASSQGMYMYSIHDVLICVKIRIILCLSFCPKDTCLCMCSLPHTKWMDSFYPLALVAKGVLSSSYPYVRAPVCPSVTLVGAITFESIHLPPLTCTIETPQWKLGWVWHSVTLTNFQGGQGAEGC